jgi:hypothetical protein
MANPVVNNVDGSNAGPNVTLLPDTIQLPTGNIWKSGIFSLTLSPVAVAAASAPEQSFAATGIGLVVGDFVQVTCTAPLAGVGPLQARVSAADTLTIQFINPTAGSLTPTASTVYLVSVIRPQPLWTAPAVAPQLDW